MREPNCSSGKSDFNSLWESLSTRFPKIAYYGFFLVKRASTVIVGKAVHTLPAHVQVRLVGCNEIAASRGTCRLSLVEVGVFYVPGCTRATITEAPAQ